MGTGIEDYLKDTVIRDPQRWDPTLQEWMDHRRVATKQEWMVATASGQTYIAAEEKEEPTPREILIGMTRVLVQLKDGMVDIERAGRRLEMVKFGCGTVHTAYEWDTLRERYADDIILARLIDDAEHDYEDAVGGASRVAELVEWYRKTMVMLHAQIRQTNAIYKGIEAIAGALDGYQQLLEEVYTKAKEGQTDDT